MGEGKGAPRASALVLLARLSGRRDHIGSAPRPAAPGALAFLRGGCIGLKSKRRSFAVSRL